MKIFILLLTLILPQIALAEGVTLDFGENGTASARILQLIALITILSVAPSILVMVTSFTRIVVVLSFLRSALGTQQTPPNMVIISLSLFLTAFIMTPTLEEAYNKGVSPLINEKISEGEAIEEMVKPFKKFMITHTREKDLEVFYSFYPDSEKKEIKDLHEMPLQVVVPSFMVSELRRAFEIGFLIFLPFLIIDMLVSSILMAMGMMMLPPVMISLPFKLIFFVVIDGWTMISGSLIKSFG